MRMHVCALRGNVRSSVMDEQSRPSWTDHLSPVGLHYFAGVVENAEDLIERHKVATQCSFGTRSSTKKAHPCTAGGKENHDEAATAKVLVTVQSWCKC